MWKKRASCGTIISDFKYVQHISDFKYVQQVVLQIPLGYNVVLNTFRKYVTMYIQILIMANSP